MSWQLRDVSVRYPGSNRWALRNISRDIGGAALFAFIGPNGAGKSTLVRALLGVTPITSGTALFDGRPVGNWNRLDLAKRVSVLAQGEQEAFDMPARDVVSMGRYPHLGLWQGFSRSDDEFVEHAMCSCGVDVLADRPMAQLSGGERQRVRIARVIAQDGSVMVFDEPTASLDLRCEMEVFGMLRALARQGRTVVTITHNVNLAARYADVLLMLRGGQLVAAGAPRDVMLPSILEDVYGWPVRVDEHRGPGWDTGAPQLTPIAAPATTASGVQS